MDAEDRRERTLLAIHGGGDWADASAHYIMLPTDVDIKDVKKAWRVWYRGTYCLQNKASTCLGFPYTTPHPEFFNLAQFAVRFHGATWADIDITEDDA